MRYLLHRFSRYLFSRSWRRGFLEGNSLWMAVGSLAFLLRILSRPERVRIDAERLRVGEGVIVRHVDGGPPRRARRRRPAATTRQPALLDEG